MYYHTLSPGAQVLVTQLQFEDGQMIPAGRWGRVEKVERLELTEEEAAMKETIKATWSSILSGAAIEESTDFFKSGAGSMDVTRYMYSTCTVERLNNRSYL